MFERFTEEAREAVVHAQHEAQALGHNYIGTEHLLLGLLANPHGVGGRTLASLGLSSARVRSDVVAMLGRGIDEAEALASIGIDLDLVRRRVEETFGPGALDRPRRRRRWFHRARCESFTGRRPFTPRSKKALELAVREAASLGHGYLGTEHLLLGLLDEREGVAVELLERAGLSTDRVREAVFTQLAA